LLKTGEEHSAVELLKDILAKQPANSKANQQLGLIYYNKASEVFDNANNAYNELKEPTRLDYHNYREEIQKAGGDHQKSFLYLEKSNSTDPKDYIGHVITITKSRLRQLKQKK